MKRALRVVGWLSGILGVVVMERTAPRLLGPGERRSPMPWLGYAGMTEEDLGAIYDYLRTLEPVRHEVVRYAREVAAPE